MFDGMQAAYRLKPDSCCSAQGTPELRAHRRQGAVLDGSCPGFAEGVLGASKSLFLRAGDLAERREVQKTPTPSYALLRAQVSHAVDYERAFGHETTRRRVQYRGAIVAGKGDCSP